MCYLIKVVFTLMFLNLIVPVAYSQTQAPVGSTSWCWICAERIDLRYQEFKDRRDPYAPDHDSNWAYRAALDWNLQLIRFGYWNNSVHTEALDSGVVKTVGWHWELGFHIPPLGVDVFHEHHSQHVMDQAGRERDGDEIEARYFPVEDSFGVRINLYERK